MASDGPKVSIAIEVDSSQARDALKKFEAALADSAKKQVVSLSGLGGAFGAVTAAAFAAAAAAIAGLTAATVHYAKIGAEVQANEVRAFAIMERRTAMTSSAKAALLDFNATLQKQIGVDGDAVLAAQATMSAMGVRRKDTESATKAMLGLSAVFGKDIPASAAIVGRVFAGELPKSLQKMGVYARDATDAQRQLVEMFKVAAAEGQTFAGRVSAAEQAWGDLQETIGLSVVGSGSLKGAIDSIRGALEGLGEYFGSPEGKKAVSDFFATIVRSASSALQAMIGMIQATRDLDGWLTDHEQSSLGTRAMVGGASFVQQKLIGYGVLPAASAPLDEPRGPKVSATSALEGILQRLADSLAESGKRGADSEFVGPPAPAAGGAKFGRDGGGAGKGGKEKGPKKTDVQKMSDANGAIPAVFDGPIPDWMVEDLKARSADNLKDVFADYRAKLKGEQELAEHEASMGIGESSKGLADTVQSLGQQIADGMSSCMTDAFVSVANGSKNVLEALGGMVGGMITMLGTMMIQLGSAALAAAALSVIPIFATVVGPPGMGVGAALAAIAVGMGLVGVGTAISGASGGSGSAPTKSSAGSGGGGGSGGGSARTPSFVGDLGINSYVPGGSGGGNVTYQLVFNGPMGGSPRAVARSITDAIDSAGSLKPARRR